MTLTTTFLRLLLVAPAVFRKCIYAEYNIKTNNNEDSEF